MPLVGAGAAGALIELGIRPGNVPDPPTTGSPAKPPAEPGMFAGLSPAPGSVVSVVEPPAGFGTTLLIACAADVLPNPLNVDPPNVGWGSAVLKPFSVGSTVPFAAVGEVVVENDCTVPSDAVPVVFPEDENGCKEIVVFVGVAVPPVPNAPLPPIPEVPVPLVPDPAPTPEEVD